MKKIWCLLLALMLVLLTGCSLSGEQLMEELNDPQLQQKTQTVLDCMLAQDVDGAWMQMVSACTKEEFKAFYEQVKPLLETVDTYTLEPSYVQVNVTNGVHNKSIRYLLTAGETELWVTAVEEEGADSLVGFHIYMVTRETGTLATAKENDALQWVLITIGLLEIAFMIVMLIDCIRHKMKKKWLWILLILLGGIIVLLNVTPQNMGVRFNYGFFLNCYTALIKYNTGGFTFRLYIPAGAIAYLCLRKSLFKKWEEATAPQALPEEIPVQILSEEPPVQEEEQKD